VAWVNLSQRDLLGVSTLSHTPDGGLMTAITNNIGQVRFTQNAMAAALGLVLYVKFDRYGRNVEAGLVPSPWNVTVLTQNANDPAWPTAADGARPIRTIEYGQDVTALNSLGRPVRTMNFDEITGQATTADTNAYDAQGNIAANGTIPMTT
jgi:large repetitive protein